MTGMGDTYIYTLLSFIKNLFVPLIDTAYERKYVMYKKILCDADLFFMLFV
jgi:hypothetical protein